MPISFSLRVNQPVSIGCYMPEPKDRPVVNFLCPYCNWTHEFTLIFFQPKYATYVPGFLISNEHNPSDIYNTVWVCKWCYKNVTIELQAFNKHDKMFDFRYFRPEYFRIIDFYPKNVDLDVPDYLPETIELIYREGLICYNNRTFNACEIMMRKTLDIATKQLGGTNKFLYNRINELAANNIITKDLADWAHVIRMIGNDGAHEEVFASEHETIQAVKFTELFLVYTFQLPRMLKERREGTWQLKPDNKRQHKFFSLFRRLGQIKIK
jgi:hypothetical protein